MSPHTPHPDEGNQTSTASTLWRMGTSPWTIFILTSMMAGWIVVASFVPQIPPTTLNQSVEGGNWQILRMFDAHNFSGSWVTWVLAMGILVSGIGIAIRKTNKVNLLASLALLLGLMAFQLKQGQSTQIRIVLEEQRTAQKGLPPTQFVDQGQQFVSKGARNHSLPFSIACEAEDLTGLPCWIRTADHDPIQVLIPAMGRGSVTINGVRLTWVKSSAGSQDRILTFSDQNESATTLRVGHAAGDALVFTGSLFTARREADDERSSLQIASLPIGGLILFGNSGTNVIGVDSRVDGQPLAKLHPMKRVLPVRSVMPLRRIELAAVLPPRSSVGAALNKLVPGFLVMAVIAAMLAVGMTPSRSEPT